MSDPRPNIVYIITDQQRYDTINALGFPHMETPNLDRLVREGTSFSHCYAAGMSCAPSRASIFTNYYPHTTGILKNACTWRRSWFDIRHHNRRSAASRWSSAQTSSVIEGGRPDSDPKNRAAR